MPHAEHTVTINCSAEDVFDYLAEGTNNTQWRPGVVEIQPTGNAHGVGTSYRQVLKGPGGRRIDGDYRITTYDRPSRLAFEVIAGPLRPTGTFDLRPAGPGSTTLTFRLAAAPTGMMRLMTPLIARQVRAETRQLDKLKDVLERR